ncbi:MAG: helix-turn-helix domain-containing protein [Candidatus Spechtbacterales bacterium]|nr:helix-turn-helix domain-containing protein [Candidatus Spechtbacterales bacterium]
MADSTQIQKLAGRLEELGLSDKEARVYVASLFLGPSAVQNIAKQADINRPTAYVILEQLEEKGLVSESNEQKRTVYVAEDPEAVERWLIKQERDIENKKKHFKNILPELEATQREAAPEAPRVRFYRGKDGIMTIITESNRKVKPKAEVYGLTNVDEVKKMFPEYPKNTSSLRLKKNMPSKVLYWSKDKDALPTNKKALRLTKRLDSPVDADISLLEDRAIIFTYRGKDSMGIVIESKEIVGALRYLFELAWERQNGKDSKK